MQPAQSTPKFDEFALRREAGALRSAYFRQLTGRLFARLAARRGKPLAGALQA